MAPQEPGLRLHQVSLAYPGCTAVRALSGEFAVGSLTALIGPNGGGKSTLLAALAGRHPLQQGWIETPPALRRHAFLPQSPRLDRSFPISALELVASGLWQQTGAWRGFDTALRRQASAALELVGLAGLERRTLQELSNGQFQRLLFARIVLQDAPLILLDEPFNAVDARTTADLLGLIQRWHTQGRTVVAVLHDREQVRAHFPRCLALAGEALAWGPTGEVLAHTQQALAA